MWRRFSAAAQLQRLLMVTDDVFRDYVLMGFICNPYFSFSQEELKSCGEVSRGTPVTLEQVCLCKTYHW